MATPHVDPETGILRLPGHEPSWIWTFTCPTRGCSCRSALVLATPGDREILQARGAPVSEAWLNGSDHLATAVSLAGVTAFQLDLDSAEVGPLGGDTWFTPDDLAARPDLRRVVEQIDGEVLDAIGRLWYLGKGMRDPEEEKREAPLIEVKDWTAGELVSWNEVLFGVREDLYIVDDRVFEATDLYCVAKGCSCGEVLVDVSETRPGGARHVGAIRISGSGEAVLEPAHDSERPRLERLWAAFQHRHPRYHERFARRAAAMQELGHKIVASSGGRKRGVPVVATVKVGRNEACPCGSGKKYKKCCGAA